MNGLMNEWYIGTKGKHISKNFDPNPPLLGDIEKRTNRYANPRDVYVTTQIMEQHLSNRDKAALVLANIHRDMGQDVDLVRLIAKTVEKNDISKKESIELLIKYILTKGNKDNLLVRLARIKETSLFLQFIVNVLFEADAIVRNEALSSASKNGHTSIVQHAVDSIQIDNYILLECIHGASFKGHTFIVEMLLNKIKKRPGNNELEMYFNALLGASENGHSDIVRLLINAGADPRYRHSFVVEEASRKGFTETVDVLLSVGADADKDNYFGAMWSASKNGHATIVEMLLKVGAPPTEEAIQVAYEEGHMDIVRMLENSK